MGIKWKRSELYIRSGLCAVILQEAWPWLGLSCTSGRRIRIRILCEENVSYSIFSPKLLWLVQQFWSFNECRWELDLLLPNTQACWTENCTNEQPEAKHSSEGQVNEVLIRKFIFYSNLNVSYYFVYFINFNSNLFFTSISHIYRTSNWKIKEQKVKSTITWEILYA